MDASKPDGTPRKLMDISRCMLWDETSGVQLQEEFKKHMIGFRKCKGSIKEIKL
jgi:hypothetical protein